MAGSWAMVDLEEYLDRYRDQQVVIIAPLGQAPDPTHTCGICGFVINDVGGCPRCELITEATKIG